MLRTILVCSGVIVLASLGVLTLVAPTVSYIKAPETVAPPVRAPYTVPGHPIYRARIMICTRPAGDHEADWQCVAMPGLQSYYRTSSECNRLEWDWIRAESARNPDRRFAARVRCVAEYEA